MRDDFFKEYLEYSNENEVPTFFHRWVAVVSIGALLGRQFSFSLGHFNIMPNMYAMLIGNPGTRKSTAIKIMRQLLVKSGYQHIAADKTTKEKFLMDLAREAGEHDGTVEEDILSANLWGSQNDLPKDPAECFIMADEFNDFFGNNNIEFISLLGTLWDFSGTYQSRIKNGKSLSIYEPTISIMGGNTPTSFALAFPTDILGQGFFSRLLLIHGESTGKKITFPKAPTPEHTAEIITKLLKIKATVQGIATLDKDAEALIDKIYKAWEPMPDVRFESYSTRRLTHLIKLCLIMAASRCSTNINSSDVIYANTLLTHTEHLMPKALGEFGKAKHSDVANRIIQILSQAKDLMTLVDIFKQVHKDLDRIEQLVEIMRNLEYAKKVLNVRVESGAGFLINKSVNNRDNSDCLDFDMLTREEREGV